MTLASDSVEICICQGPGEKNTGMTNSFGSHEYSGSRQEERDGGREVKGGGEEVDGERVKDTAQGRGVKKDSGLLDTFV